MGVIDMSTSQWHNIFIRSLFGALDTPLERSIRGPKFLCEKHQISIHVAPRFPKKCRLGPQNGSGISRPKKLLKIVNYQNCQKTILSQLENMGGHRYPPGSLSFLTI
jgi:hypothetical protein